MINCFDQERKPRKSGLRECSIVFVMFVNVLRKGRSRARAQAEGLSSVRTARRTHFSIQPLPLYLLYAGSRVEVRRGPSQRAFLPCNQGGANDTPSDRLWGTPGPACLRNTRWRLSAASTRACPRPTRRRSVTLTPLGSSSVQSAPHLPAQSGIASARRAASLESARPSCAAGSKTETSSSRCVCLRHASTLSRLKADRPIRRGSSLGLTTAEQHGDAP